MAQLDRRVRETSRSPLVERTLGQRWNHLWGQLKGSQSQLPTCIEIAVEHDLDLESHRTPFQIGKHYFSVVIDQMFLRDGREWLSTYEPLVFVVSEFAYGGEMQTVPFVVGAPLLEGSGVQLPQGMLYTGTRVAGLHPYRGAGLKLTVILYKVESKNYGREIIQLTQSVTQAFDLATALVPYVKVATTVFDAVEALLDRSSSTPVIGARNEFPSGSGFIPRHYVLIDAPIVDSSRLWVMDGSLMTGDSRERLTPYRNADFVLYGINQSVERDDVEMLPLNTLWARVQREAATKGPEAWESAKANMAILYQDLVVSADLTVEQRRKLTEAYKNAMLAIHADIPVMLGAAEPEAEDDFREVRDESVAMLRL